jgi:putative sigma-54 modulation protein
MRVDIVARRFEIADSTRDYIHKEIEHRLGTLYDRITTCKMIVERENNAYIAEIITHVPGEQLTAKQSTEELTKSIDFVVKKMQRQVAKHKDKWK